MRFHEAFETSRFLAEKVASAPASRVGALRARQAVVDFTTFGLFKQGAIDPQSLARGLGWGVGLGLPALGVGHLLAHDARRQGEHLMEHARNQALMTAAGVGGMQALGELLKQRQVTTGMAPAVPSLGDDQKLAAAVLVDDILERTYAQGDASTKQATLTALFVHRHESTELLRSLLT